MPRFTLPPAVANGPWVPALRPTRSGRDDAEGDGYALKSSDQIWSTRSWPNRRQGVSSITWKPAR